MNNKRHSKTIIISQHAQQQLSDRGASKNEVRKAVLEGEEVPAKKVRKAFRKNFSFNAEWKGRHYEIKQVVPIIAKEPQHWVVVTVFVFYFGGEKK